MLHNPTLQAMSVNATRGPCGKHLDKTAWPTATMHESEKECTCGKISALTSQVGRHDNRDSTARRDNGNSLPEEEHNSILGTLVGLHQVPGSNETRAQTQEHVQARGLSREQGLRE